MTRPIKTILVSLNNTAFFDSNMAMAARIAREYDSHIIGLYVIPSVIIYAAPYGYGGPLNFSELNRFYRSKAASAEDDFNDFVRKEGLKGEWRKITSAGHFVSETIIDHGREADLIILGDDKSVETEMQFEGAIVHSTGRPVLVVPHNWPPDTKFNKVVMGWDGSRESARAAFDSIPLLKMAKKTEVTSFNAHKERQLAGDAPGAEMANALARYDINAEAVSENTRKSVGQALMDRAASADLLVIGAYGHSRLRENILGGVTKLALKSMPCPVLLSN